MTREIRLSIAPATATHCGLDLTRKCRGLKLREENMRCEPCGEDLEYDEIYHDAAPRRVTACVAAQLESEWTNQRPTEAGDYELSILPEKRTSRGSQFPAVIACEVAFWSRPLDEGPPGLRVKYKSGGMWLPLVDNEWLDGALWRKLVEIPIDPFLGAPCSSSQQ